MTQLGAQFGPPRPSCACPHTGTRAAARDRQDARRPSTTSGVFPPSCTRVYPAPGSPALARRTAAAARGWAGRARQLGSGSRHVVRAVTIFPPADVPVVQLSLDATAGPRAHFELARDLRPLREGGCSCSGSGNIVHNLRRIDRRLANAGFDWAIEFDARVKALIDSGDHLGLIRYDQLGRAGAALRADERALPPAALRASPSRTRRSRSRTSTTAPRWAASPCAR